MPQGNFVPPRFEARLSFFSQYFLSQYFLLTIRRRGGVSSS
jgi:hypothetical protein